MFGKTLVHELNIPFANLAYRRFVAVLCVLYKITLNQMHHLYGALVQPHVPVLFTLGALVTIR